ncbi:MAG: toll/interleukin-1 receptor domain-containing protein [Thermodesulfobacteriota bacterium]
MSAKTVFISYRRDASGKPFARALKQELKHRGYDAFLDVDDMDAGRWQAQIEPEIRGRAHFLLILTPGALDRCADEADWLRRELALALASCRNIVPVREESVDLGELRQHCPECMQGVLDLQVCCVRHDAFERDVDELVDRYLPPHKASKPAVELAHECLVAPPRLRQGAERLFGRDEELAFLDRAWEDPAIHVLSLVAWGGAGKTALVVEWMNRRAAAGWPGFERVFDWTFCRPAPQEQGEASADTFTAAALDFFGDPGLARSAASPWDKGARLARLVAERPSLLVLDGLEPLQHPPGAQGGKLKDPVLEVLIPSLARQNRGLCLLTTREGVADLEPYRATTAPVLRLERMSVAAGVAFLASLGVHGCAAELVRLVDDTAGHALTLRLVGSYLAKAHGGDVRRRDRVRLGRANPQIQGGCAFEAMAAYEKWLAQGGEAGARQLALLRLLGLFDRPADPSCLAALLCPPAIPGLTDPLVGIDEEDWNCTVTELRVDCGLIAAATREGDGPGGLSLDTHPLVREYFAKRLQEKNPDGWREAHRRLYEHLKASTAPQPETLDGLQPLYQAVAHGCRAGLAEEACNEVYRSRILRRGEFFSIKQLGAFGADLGAVACFFDQPWGRTLPGLSPRHQAWLLNEAAFRLRALGRLAEALEPMRGGLRRGVELKDWHNAARGASNLSELELALGEVAAALRDAEKSVDFADCNDDPSESASRRTTLADALHQAGHPAAALALFREAEDLQAAKQPAYPLLRSLRGFRYCDLLLAEGERAAWRRLLGRSDSAAAATQDAGGSAAEHREVLQQIASRGQQMLDRRAPDDTLLDTAFNHLILGRANLYRSLLAPTPAEAAEAGRAARDRLADAVQSLRRAGTQHHIPRGLLSRAWLRAGAGDAAGARADLDEAWEIAERGPMRLHLADIHLHRARLFFRTDLAQAGQDLAAARVLVDQCGYHRRDQELQDAEAVLGAG